ncbi:DUF998 domain-containing protein [Dactylosporangium siamense]|uniref:DUF998 domain-containing protein n=1 Tax=Dactylosporangium siamense TaxID=685454 RepID=A0A919PG49_9ACTN|nr:DUF998 domain-containing protein [Dactylosporangium siamense]GIG44235.1 hypothetical protein Dsi01nite_022760 [Dactylosporangium siamense]
MTTTTIPAAATAAATVPAHIRANRVTRSLLGYGVLAGPFYVTVSLTQALTRDGFDLTRHAWSLLANGEHGWIQVTNFILTGLMVIAAAVGLHRALPAAPWAGRLTGVYGAGMIAAGVLRADPAMGFPAGTPEGPGTVSWHGLGHLTAGGIGFLCVIAACFVVARRFARDGRKGWAVYSRISGALFLVGFAGIAAPALTVGFIAAVIVIWTWLAAVSIDLYRALPCPLTGTP